MISNNNSYYYMLSYILSMILKGRLDGLRLYVFASGNKYESILAKISYSLH